MSWLTKPRKGRIFAFSSYLMYNPKAFRDMMTFIRWGQPIMWCIMALIFIYTHITFLAVLFTVFFVISAYQLYKYIRWGKAITMTVAEAKEIMIKDKKQPYAESKIVSGVNRQHGRD